jgi:hypothetical protein
MKQIIKLGKGNLIQLDSYRESRETRRWNWVVAFFAILIATFTAGAIFGIDITSPDSTQQHDNTRRTDP